MIGSFVRRLLPSRRPVAYAARLPRVVFLTGAGLSADSGLATYRGAGGVYESIPAEKIMTPATLEEKPELVHRFCDDRRVALGAAEPNAAHNAIAALAATYGDRLTHVTMNVDDLTERAGYADSVHVHGMLTFMRSTSDPDIREDIGYTRYWDGDITRAAAKGFGFKDGEGKYYRPDVVLFGEQTKLYHRMFLVLGALHPDDILVVIGTSGTVLPINRWTANAECRKVLVNPHRSEAIDEKRFDVVHRAGAAEAAAHVVSDVRSRLG